MTDGRTRRVFVEMFREEWRLHGHLFGGERFGLFPVVIGLLAAGTAALLSVTGTEPGTVFAGLHALALIFGLHTGTIGFVGQDALRNLLGDLTLLVFSARTLPLSKGRLLALFVVKDVVYYALLFLAPISLGTVAAVVALGQDMAIIAGFGTVALLWTTLLLTFVFGMGATLAGLGLTGRGVPKVAVLAGLAAVVGAGWVGDLSLVDYTPYGVFLDRTLPRIGATGGTILAVFLVAAVTFDADGHRSARTVGPAFRRWRGRVGDPVATKTLLDVHRSAGGFGKVLFSAAVLFGATASLVDLAGRITGVSPSVGVSFGTLLGLSGFTTYNWLTQSDDVDSYLVQPLTVADVFAAKFRAFLLLGPAVAVGFYVLALAWRGGPVLEALVGAVLLVGVACYIFGITIYLAGLSPNEFLFDSVLFAVFGLAMVVPLVPVLVVGFALAPVSVGLLAALGLGGVVLGTVGIGLYRRSLPKWSRHHRRG